MEELPGRKSMFINEHQHSHSGTPKELHSQVKSAHEKFADFDDYNRTHLWRDRQGAEGANSWEQTGIISQAKGQRKVFALIKCMSS